MIEIEMLTIDPLYVIKDADCITVGKRAKRVRTETHEEAKAYFKEKFIEEHSTIEWVHFRFVDDDCRGDVSSHIVRQTKSLPRFAVQSSRPDWNGGEKRKPLDETFIKFGSLWNPLSFMQMCRQRLCKRASAVDREWLKDILTSMRDSGDPFFEALSECCVPNCIYRGGCPERRTCGFYDHTAIQARYDNFNKVFSDMKYKD